MISTTPIERIAALLVDAGYKRLSVPLTVLKLSFDLGAAFIGGDMSSDLIVAIDSVDRSELRMVQIVEALSRALDSARSRRSLTVVIVGPRPVPSTLERLSRVARVLPVGVASDADTLRDWLAVLLPLNIPAIPERPAPVLRSDDSDEAFPDVLTTGFEHAALRGEIEVQQLLIRLVELPFKEIDQADDIEAQ